MKLQDKHALLAHAACLYAVWEDFARAARLQGASEALRRRIGAGLSGRDAADREAQRAEVRVALGEVEYAAAWAAGEALTDEQAAALTRD